MSLLRKYFTPPYSLNVLIVLVALFLSLVDNVAFLGAVNQVVNKTQSLDWDFKIAVFICLPAIFSILLALPGIGLFKPFAIIILLCASVVSYFMNSFGVIIDASMIQNAFETDTKEALELINTKLLGYVVLTGLLPAWLVYQAPLDHPSFNKTLLKRLILIAVAALILAVTIFSYYKSFSLTTRANRELRFLINPTYPIYALFKYTKQLTASKQTLKTIATDARQLPALSTQRKPTLLVLVVGETARAQSFSLNGYGRQTNPQLSKLDIINYPNTYSCGTATAESLPCMFSHLPKVDYSVDKAKQYENLLDILQRAGVKVLWRDNNSGCKGVCDRVGSEAFDKAHDQQFCNSEECFDEILLKDLQQQLQTADGDQLVVLHQKGSHGPAYYKRHPPAFTLFAPECSSGQVQDCSQEQIANAYDNTILYTDHFLAQTIALLKQQNQHYDTALWYMSDHGESLGENGIYLHGLPYFLAPDQQVHIPFVLWLSPELQASSGIQRDCMLAKSKAAHSHDHIFHSVLALFRVQSQIYQADLDIFAACQPK